MTKEDQLFSDMVFQLDQRALRELPTAIREKWYRHEAEILRNPDHIEAFWLAQTVGPYAIAQLVESLVEDES